MVKLVVKKGDEELFLYEATVDTPINDLLEEIIPIYNGRLKVHRICGEIEQLADHGITLPPNMMGLTEEQIEDLKLKDEWADKCIPSGGSEFKNDDIGRRNGQAPNPQMTEVLKKTVKEAKDMIHKNTIKAGQVMSLCKVQEAVEILRGATMIVYPMGLPPHDPIRMELENEEDLSGTQASQEVIDHVDQATLWWAGKEFIRGKKLMDFVGKNEKTKIVCKITKKGAGAPSREKVVSEEDQKQMMAYYYKKQEDFKKLEAANDDAYLDSSWADTGSLKKQFQGLTNVKWGPGK